MFKAMSILFFSISFTVHSYEIFQFNKDHWQYFNGLPSASIKQPFIVNKISGVIGVITDEILPSSSSSLPLREKCNSLSKNNIFKTSYCKIIKKDEISFLFGKKFETATFYQLVTFKNQQPRGIKEFEGGLK